MSVPYSHKGQIPYLETPVFKVFYVMGKALPGELFCIWTSLVGGDNHYYVKLISLSIFEFLRPFSVLLFL